MNFIFMVDICLIFFLSNFIVRMYIQSFEHAKSLQSYPTLLHFKQDYWSGLPSLLQGIFPTQGSNPRLLVSCIDRWDLYH